jgi:cytochrome P450
MRRLAARALTPAARMGFVRMLLLAMDPPAHRRHRNIVAGARAPAA